MMRLGSLLPARFSSLLPVRWLFHREENSEPHFTFKASLTAEKQAQLERLCEKLLQNADFVNSGKLQLVGLSKIKKRLGRRWVGLSKIIYSTVEEVIEKHLHKDDLFLRYKSETYLVLFLATSPQMAKEKITLIATEIRQRLFELGEQDLRELEISEAAHIISADALAGYNFSDFLDAYIADDNHFDCLLEFEKMEADSMAGLTAMTEVDADDVKPENTLSVNNEDITVAYQYQPLWEVKRNAITTYLCEAQDQKSKRLLFNAYNSTRNRDAQHKLSLDIEILNNIRHELDIMEKERRKVLLSCPVQYQTLHNFESYEQYKNILQTIPDFQRQFLIFHVVDTEENLPLKDTYWFAKPLRQFGRFIFAEVPLRRDINFSFLQKTGVNVVGTRLRDNVEDEDEIIKMLGNFSTRAKSLYIPRTFLFGVNSLSIATSAMCAGFDFIGGRAVHEKSTKPGNIEQYHAGNLINATIKMK